MKVNREIITKIIKELGIPANLKGYRFITYGVELLINDIQQIDSIMGFYKSVAEKFNTTPSCAERAIRHAIEVGWNRANIEFVNKLFGYTIDSNKGKPTNSEFLATVADYIVVMQERDWNR